MSAPFTQNVGLTDDRVAQRPASFRPPPSTHNVLTGLFTKSAKHKGVVRKLGLPYHARARESARERARGRERERERERDRKRERERERERVSESERERESVCV